MSDKAVRIILWAGLFATIAWGSATHARYSAYSPAVAADEKPAATQVKIDNFSFTPEEITVAAGGTVTWTNADDVPHTVTSSENKFKSKPLDTDDQFSFTFRDPGTYEYYCSVHPKMIAKIIVK